MTKKIITYLTGFIFAALSFKGQDFHVSHYDVATMYLNPALTGVYGLEKGDYRVYVDQRSQWRALGIKPYLTSYIAYDMPCKIKNKSVGLGGYIINNNSGIGNYNTLTFMPSASYNVLGDKAKYKHVLTVGLQMGLFYRSTNPNKLNYDVQYSLNNNGGAFDQNIANNEAYNRVNITRFDANFGLFYRYVELNKKARPYAGFTMAHLTRPNESMTGAQSQLPIKWVGNAGCDIKLDEKLDITPRILFMSQAKAYEFTSGFLFYYKMNENNTKVFAGFDYRLKDACIISLGLKHDNYAVRLSYDINTSYLNKYTRSRGAFEVSLVYTGEKGKSFFKSVSSF
ncbi:MAG: PorP/SprF family type IX secretion system membrane protein [Bacteroidota bacterium]|nr:PorP/SprF family type IX secretion system membrane protein [Bacteroidota bacterium]MDP3145675.1 PorP/SprF family type IX secretion system membrane protein [Bacteroidota bacterium]MDP3558650.1 PorP/SprF family type IX secretion system membrane protein [Bacteroidota bacterium]